MNNIEKYYIGDGVYIHYDGYQLWLTTDTNRIALEPEVFWTFLNKVSQFPEYAALINNFKNNTNDPAS